MDGPLCEHLRHRIDETCRRQLGAELDDDGRTHIPEGPRTSLAFAACEAADGDPLLALCLALNTFESRRAHARDEV